MVDSMEEKLEEDMREVKEILREIQKQVERGKQEEVEEQEGWPEKRRKGEEGTDRNLGDAETDVKVRLEEGDWRAETSKTSDMEKRTSRTEPKEDGDRKQEGGIGGEASGKMEKQIRKNMNRKSTGKQHRQ